MIDLNSYRGILLGIVVILSLSACSKAAEKTNTKKIYPGNGDLPINTRPILPDIIQGRAVLGLISNGKVEVFDVTDFVQGAIFETVTSTSSNLDEVGYFEIPSSTFDNGDLFLIKVSG